MMLAGVAAAWADYAVIDGVRYELSNYEPYEAYVVAPESGVYTGAITIPATINSGGVDYAVTQISSGAFENSTITSLSLPVGLRYIFSSFAGTSLTSLTIPGTVTYLIAIGECTSLTSITFAYDGIDGITDEYYWPSGYTEAVELGYDCFASCTNLTEITVDRRLYNNGYNYTPLFKKATKATFGPHATNIPMCAFMNCTLEELTIGANVTEIEQNAFYKATLPEGYAFPFSQMKKIGGEAFYECKNLPAAIDLSAVEEIKTQAFSWCTDIQSLTIGACNLAAGAFHGCSNLSSLTLAEGLTDTGDSNFQNLEGLTTVTFPSTLKRIGGYAFQNCPNLTLADGLPAGLEEIGDYAFSQCTKVNATLPSTLKKIGASAFSYSGMESVTLPASLTEIGTYAFSDCESLKTINIPYAEGVLTLETTFQSSNNVENIIIDRNFTVYNASQVFAGSIEKTNVTIGTHVTAIPDYAFYSSSFKSLILGANVASIGENAFLYATIPSLTLPIACTTIGKDAFSYSYIDNLYVPYLTPIALPTEHIEQLFNYSNTKLWVPGGTIAQYQAADGWKLFTNMDYWSYVVTSDVAGKGTLAIANGEDVTDNGTNTAQSVVGENLVEAGAGTPVSGLFVREKDLTLTSTPARGYELSALTANDADIKAAAKVENLLADQTIHATFTPIIYNIVYNLNGGTVVGGSPVETYTVESDAITLVNPTRTAYIFKGWTGTDLTEATMTVTIPANSIGDREYTATWEPIVYDITYDLAGGTVPDGSAVGTYTIETPDFTLTNPTRLGYTFTGWTGTDLTDKTVTVTVTTGHWGNRAYTATWEPNPYKVRFAINGGDGTETMADQNFVYDAAQQLTENAYTSTGYTFKEWSLTADGTGTKYQDKAEVVNLTAVRDEVVTLYAQWTPNPYQVRFNANEGEGTMANQDFVYDAEQALTENAFTRTGYTFKQWTANADGSGASYADKASVKNLTAELNGIVDIYAQWQVVPYTISYDLAGGTVATVNPTEYTIESAAITLVNPTREGYDFAGWTGTDITGTAMTVTIATGSTGNRSYTATWTPIVYAISYDLAGGSVATANPTEYTIETPTFTLTNPTREHYDFTGWTGTDLSAATQTVTVAVGSMGDRSYTATWEKKTYTVSITSNVAGMVTASTTTPKYQDDVVLTIGTDDDLDLVSVVVDGVDVTSQISGGKYTIQSVSANVSVVVTYASNKEFITMEHPQATFSCTQALDFTGTGLKAYIASGFMDGTVLLTRVDVVPANTGLLIVGTEGETYKVPYTTTKNFYVNLLKPVLTAQVIPTTSGEYTNYLYGEVNDVKGFYKSSGSGEVAAKKAYLQLPTSAVSGARVSIVFDEETTGIDGMTTVSGAAVYNMNGLKVADEFNPKRLPKGVYIVGGKKVVVNR